MDGFLRQESAESFVQRPQFVFGEPSEERDYRGEPHHGGGNDVSLPRPNSIYVDRLGVAVRYSGQIVRLDELQHLAPAQAACVARKEAERYRAAGDGFPGASVDRKATLGSFI